MIPSNKTYLPPREEYEKYLDQIWESGWVTNDGDLLEKLESELKECFRADYVRIVSSGTFALQIAIRALDLDGDVVTTPFSYVATTGALIWEKCDPVFADIDPDTFTIDPATAEAAITPDTSALLPTHVFGVPCDVEALDAIADEHDVSLLYDGAHAFGTEINGRSLMTHGDMTAISFHATKLFHTVEGGAIVTDDPNMVEQIELTRAFGHRGNDHFCTGINAKNSELHAAMGLCLLSRMDEFIDRRREAYQLYTSLLDDLPLQFQEIPASCTYNYSYFPGVFPSHECMMTVKRRLEESDIHARRYFTPSLNKLPYVEASECPVAEAVADRILCLPFFQEITAEQIKQVAAGIRESWPTEPQMS